MRSVCLAGSLNDLDKGAGHMQLFLVATGEGAN